ncbi:MAG: iron-containing redox enzyme family protein [Mycobacteriales bacterium]
MSDSTLLDTSPAWLQDLDQRCQPHLLALREFPKVVELDADRMRRSMVQAGIGIVQPFPHWLAAMKQRVQSGSKAYRFLSENEEEEAAHWAWWLDMGRAYGLTSKDFDNVTLRPPMRALSEHLTEVSRSAPMPVAIAAVNYCIETGAAQMTAVYSADFAERLGDDGGRWVVVHREGDVDHSRISRELLAELTEGDEELQRRTAESALTTYGMFRTAMADAVS